MNARTLGSVAGMPDRRPERQAQPDRYPTFEFSGAHQGLRRLHRWIAMYGALQLTLKEAAEIACLEPHYLSRAFRSRVGQTFREWTREYRLVWAVRAIESGQYSIDEVSKLVGYRGRRSLERAVKAATGKTPAVLQRRSGCGSVCQNAER